LGKVPAQKKIGFVIFMVEEKVFFKNRFGDTICGILHSPVKFSNVGIVFAHGFSSRKDKSVIVESSKQLEEAGFFVLRFDFTGSGESTKKPLDFESHIDELKNGVQFVKNRGVKKVILIGDSMGAYYILNLLNTYYDAIVFFAPKLTPGLPKDIRENPALVKELEEKGTIQFERAPGRVFEVTKKYAAAISKNDENELIQKLKVPVFILVGTKDHHLEIVKNKIKLFKKGSNFVEIDGADHPMRGFEKEFAEVTTKYIQKLVEKNKWC
jgi:pimeloyl-ACP methyl ester carboxylesterase